MAHRPPLFAQLAWLVKPLRHKTESPLPAHYTLTAWPLPGEPAIRAPSTQWRPCPDDGDPGAPPCNGSDHRYPASYTVAQSQWSVRCHSQSCDDSSWHHTHPALIPPACAKVHAASANENRNSGPARHPF
ncbi:hypothetical protein JCM19237_6994 [Photobacterium aphoticum]|uniref:Uncharacterized protein n=1 Tax=Photobacterium aphoticum TaxID=754436 RepID=A0A090RJW9_9GAMM|nr:hypothetical protein JCM19237_6994 [Photobacterium aphoticum]